VIVGVLVSGSVLAVTAVARVRELQHLVLPILLFAAFVVLMVLVGVFITAWKDPTILMLGQVTGDVYIQNRKLTLGDSTVGDINAMAAALTAPQVASANSAEDETDHE
jgi:hypothetical protein